MSYAQLHSRFADSPLHIGRNAIRDAVLQATGVNRVHIHAATLNTALCRGMYFSPRAASRGLAAYAGEHVIVFSRDLNRCWRRLVITKELMHMLDGQESATDSSQAFERVISESYGAGGLEQSPQTQAELWAFWKALCILVPESHRLRLKQQWQNDEPEKRDFRVAKELLIPATYVPVIFSDGFENIRDRLV